jgi:DNA-binding CsgD family transcriptional regulator
MSPPTWAAPMAAIVASLDSPTLPHALSELLRHSAPFTYAVIFGYHGANRPISLHDDFPADKRKVFVSDYQAGPYLLDPLYLAAVRPVPPGLYRLRDVAPDRFYQGEYYRNYYAQTGLAEEIGYFVDLPGHAVLVLSLMRTERPFSQREFAALSALVPVVASVAQRQWAGLHRQFDHDTGPADQGRQRKRVAYDISRFGEGILTSREREVAEFTLKGHSAESAGQNLGISPGTVRIHRRNIYSKLRINSQGELFSCFLDTLLDEG